MSAKGTGVSRRHFLGAIGATVVGVPEVTANAAEKIAATSPPGSPAPPGHKSGISDGPASPCFTPIALPGNAQLPELAQSDLSQTLRDSVQFAPQGHCVCWGIPFQIDRVALAKDKPVMLRWPEIRAPWLVCLHATDVVFLEQDARGFIKGSSRGYGRLNEHVADYVFLYADGAEERVAIRRRHQIGMLSRLAWGENCFQAVAQQKPFPARTASEQPREGVEAGRTQRRGVQPDAPPWSNWLWAWENPRPEKPLVGLRIEPKAAVAIFSAVTAGDVGSLPLRWEARRKAILRLPQGQVLDPNLSVNGLSKHIQLDLGQVISVLPRPLYPEANWPDTYNCKPAQLSSSEALVEYTAHPDAHFHLAGGQTIPVASLTKESGGPIIPVSPATQRVRLRVLDSTGKPVAVKLHVHGESGEYLAPIDRHRTPTPYWFEDFGAEYISGQSHFCAYIPGETVIDLPVGRVFIEISKGFEVRPLRKIVAVASSTTELTFRLERVLPWRERGWVTADTHVHFLSPSTAHLEGAAEGVNVVNLLASQWVELMTNAGDFDGRTTFGSREAGGDGEYLVRVGTENRQHVLGHISLLGYKGPIIAPMASGGPDESALGDPVEVLLTEWARQCRKQGGVVVLPHFPYPRCEHAATIVTGDADALEMTSASNLYGGIDPYSLCDWYRYLNCGHFVAAVGGTDKMVAATAIGAVRTYACLPKHRPFDFEAWKDDIRSGNTFVTYGPLLEFSVEGKPPGARLKMPHRGGTLDIAWRVASVTVPMTRVELVVNGEIRESQTVDPAQDHGHWRVKVDKSSWIALLIRGHYSEKPEIIAAHSSPVMVEVSGLPFFAAADALTILEQIEGALAFIDTVGTRAETTAYRRMRMVLLGAHRSLHNRLHQHGVFHDHPPATDDLGHKH